MEELRHTLQDVRKIKINVVIRQDPHPLEVQKK
jgi:hypothetical protein